MRKIPPKKPLKRVKDLRSDSVGQCAKRLSKNSRVAAEVPLCLFLYWLQMLAN